MLFGNLSESLTWGSPAAGGTAALPVLVCLCCLSRSSTRAELKQLEALENSRQIIFASGGRAGRSSASLHWEREQKPEGFEHFPKLQQF